MAEKTAPAPWNMRDDESAKAYRAFEVYRDMGPGRTLEKLSQDDTRVLPTLKRWSSHFAWVDRVRAFDAEVARRASAKSLNDHAEVRARQAQLGRVLQAKGAKRMAKLDPLELAPSEAIKAVDMGAKIEREALGLAAKLEVTGEGGGPVRYVIEVVEGVDDAGDDG